LKPDLICFTGDLVSRRTDEALPYKNILSTLHARDGVVSIQGNHDEALYYDWPSDEARRADSVALIDLQKEMGWKMLMNDHMIVKRDTSEIAVLGTIYFRGWPFPIYGNLDKAYPDYNTGKHFIVLLQHIPSVWKLDRFYQRRVVMARLCDKVDLMLTGHTHAMQCMITLFGHKFSPAWFVNEYWGGLYTEGDHKLYVNIGIGMVGMPARLGSATPEITVITLKKRGGCIVDDKGNRISD